MILKSIFSPRQLFSLWNPDAWISAWKNPATHKKLLELTEMIRPQLPEASSLPPGDLNADIADVDARFRDSLPSQQLKREYDRLMDLDVLWHRANNQAAFLLGVAAASGAFVVVGAGTVKNFQARRASHRIEKVLSLPLSLSAAMYAVEKTRTGGAR